jgi:ribosome-binding factor A
VAQVHVSVMGSPSDEALCFRAIQHATGHIQSVVAREVHARQCPQLRFKLDASLKGSAEVVELIEREMDKLRPCQESGAAGDAGREPEAT